LSAEVRGEGDDDQVKGVHFEKDIILTCVRWYVIYPLSYRQFEELMQERGVCVDHSTINRWVLTYSLQLEAAFHHRRRLVYVSWQMDEAYINVVKQDHHNMKRVTRSMLGDKSFDDAECTLAGIELMHMLRKGQLEEGPERTALRLNSYTPWSPNPRPSGLTTPSLKICNTTPAGPLG
jgi:transposase-like protein